jgi:uncharacterized iron-regulated membrane protein
MRRIHRALAFFFSPFLILSAVTGLLWAYAPYLYLKQDAGKPRPSISVEDQARVHLTPVEAIEASGLRASGGKVASVTLRVEAEKVLYVISSASKKDAKDIFVDAENGQLLPKPAERYPAFHTWVMKLHQLQFFGTKKELVAFPGVGLLLMLFTGIFLFKRGLK